MLEREGERANILVVDDVPANLDLLQALLEDAGHTVSLAPGGGVALAVAARRRPDLMLVDVRMEDMDGFEVCRRLQQDDVLRRIPVIFITAQDTAESAVRGFSCGAVDYITKPFRDQEVLARVETHLRLNNLHRQLVEKNQRLEEENQRREALQNQLILQAKMASLGKLVAGLAHELNNPIGAIDSAADVARRCAGTLEPLLETMPEDAGPRARKLLGILLANAEVIRTASRRVSRLVESLKFFVHLDEAEFQQVDLRLELENILELLGSKVGPEVRLVKDFGPVPTLHCAPGQLNQAFMNVLSNAFEAVGTKGEVLVQLGREGRHLRVQVRDSGPGIPPQLLKHIFDIGFSGGRRVKMGSGLCTAYAIVQEHGGTIEVASPTSGGAQVDIRLPLQNSAA